MDTTPVDRHTLAAIAPKLAELTETVLFGDIWARSELSPRERQLNHPLRPDGAGQNRATALAYRLRLSKWPEPGGNCRIIYPPGVLRRLAGGGQRPDLPERAGGAMPLTRISLGTAWRPAEFAQLSALFHECLVAEFAVPPADKFQFIEQTADGQRIYDPHYLSGGRSDRFVLFHIFAGKPRRRAQKQGLYRRLCARLADEMAVSPQDVMVVIQFNQLEDWSFSAGKMAGE